MHDTPTTLSVEQQQLLLYLAGELPADQARAIDTRLASDAALRAELESLRAAEAMLHQGLRTADAAEPIDAHLRLIDRGVGRMLQQWQVDRATRPTVATQARKSRRLPLWLYPLTAAAIVAVGLGTWSLTLGPDNEGPAPGATAVNTEEELIPDWMLETVSGDGVAMNDEPALLLEEQAAQLRLLSDALQ